MKFSPTRFFGLLFVLALALLTFWLDRVVHEDERRHPSFRRHDPDYIVENFTLTSYDREGVAQSTLAATQMLHYPDDDTTELLAPRVVHSRSGGPRMTMRADRGTLSQDGEEVFFFGNVSFEREAAAGRSATHVSTEFLHLLHGRGLVRTDRDVEVVEEGRSRFSGRGLEYDANARRFVLHGPVRGQFDTARGTP